MITRNLEPYVLELATRWPVVTITGPRQSGKTTLSRMAFPEHSHVSLEAPDVRELVRTDPRGFLAEHADGVVVDEVQRLPELLSYLQVEVDRRPEPGRFILTGSTHLALLESVSQSLAGRTAIVHLLPCSLDELRRFPDPPVDLLATVLTGGYPAIFDRRIPAEEWFRNYLTTYVERDVRQILNVGDLAGFQTFLRLCAGRTGQLLNLSQLGSDCGISHKTVKAWISVLEAGFIAYRLRSYHRNLGKREIKTAKLYFYDAGLVCALLGIHEPYQLALHPLRGFIFETWAIAEVLKTRLHRGRDANAFFYRDRKGLEIDLLIERGTSVVAVELKSGLTLTTDFFRPLERFAQRFAASETGAELESRLVYGGDTGQRRRGVRALPWSEIPSCEW